MYAVVITYNFDKTTPVLLCKTIEDAKIKLKEQFLHELEVDLMENEWDTETTIDSNSEYAKIVNHFPDHDDITEYRIGDIVEG